MAIKKVRWGILGVAKINDRLLPAFRTARNADLCAIASRSEDKARAAAKAAGIPRAHGSYEAMLDDPELDAVYIPLPNNLHDHWTRAAAERGKHVLCEKPLTPSADQARDLVAFCQSKKICLMDGFMWPHHPRTALLRKFLDEGSLGGVQRVTGCFSFALDQSNLSNIRFQPDMGGGSLLDVGCYPVYAIRWAMGAEPVRALGDGAYLNSVDVALSGVLWFADGRQASFDCGFVHPFRQWLEIVGVKGVVLVPDMWLPPPRATFEVRRDGSYQAEQHCVEGQDQIVHMLENFGRCVVRGKPASPSPEQAVLTLQRALDALATSAREGRVVEV